MGRNKRWWYSALKAEIEEVEVSIIQKRILDRCRFVNYGIQVGAVMLLKPHMSSLRQQLENVLNMKVKFREVQEIPQNKSFVIAHLFLDEVIYFNRMCARFQLTFEDAMVLGFMEHIGAVYFSNVRPMDMSICSCKLLKPINKRMLEPTEIDQSANAVVTGFSFAEVFAGIGGFRLGLDSLGGTCCFASEIDQRAVNTYRKNFSLTPLEDCVIGDILEYYSSDLPDFDILTGGFPCQSFSVRGSQKGLADHKGQLYLELVRLLRDKQPKAFLFENVVGLVLMEGGSRPITSKQNIGLAQHEGWCAGSVFNGILSAFGECGYEVSWRVINAAHWLPQNRERVYMIGIRNDIGHCMEWSRVVPRPLSQIRISTVTEEQVRRFTSGAIEKQELLPSGHVPGQCTCRPVLSAGKLRDILECPVHCADAIADATLSSRQWQSLLHKSSRKRKLVDSEEIVLNDGDVCFDDAGANLAAVYRNRALNLDTISPALISGYHSAGNITTKFVFEEDGDGRPRFLTNRECARLMGFPEAFVVGHSNHERGEFYKQIGNAVCPPVIRAIGVELMRALTPSLRA